MHKTTPRFLFLLALLSSPPSLAQIPALVQEAFDNTQPVEQSEWAYIRTTNTNGEIWIERFDPGAAPRWQLLSVNGSQPSAHQVKTATQQQSEREQNSPDRFGANDFSNLAEPGSWRVKKESGASSTYGFQPTAEEDTKGFIDALQGELVIDTAKRIVRTMRIYSVKSFKPAAVVKIKSMSTELHLDEVYPGVVLPIKIEAAVAGRAFGVKKIVENTVIRYSDFAPVQ